MLSPNENTTFIKQLSPQSKGSIDSDVLEEEIAYIRFAYDCLPHTKFVFIEYLHKADASSISMVNLLTKIFFFKTLNSIAKTSLNLMFN